MLKKLIILFFAIAPLAAVAQNVKLAYINTQEVFNAMPELSGIETQLNTKQTEIQKNAQALETEYTKKLEEFTKLAESTTTSEAVKQDKQKELGQLQERYQQFAQTSQQEFNELRQKLLEPVNKKIGDAIKAVGDEKGYAFVFDVATMNSPIVYVNNSSENITAAVKTKLGIK
ncbi:MAG: OmpH family outer membrane protein [Petrimonas sp.]|nr:OmpH family outer membrane protein [Petrimonas sp.]